MEKPQKAWWKKEADGWGKELKPEEVSKQYEWIKEKSDVREVKEPVQVMPIKKVESITEIVNDASQETVENTIAEVPPITNNFSIADYYYPGIITISALAGVTVGVLGYLKLREAADKYHSKIGNLLKKAVKRMPRNTMIVEKRPLEFNIFPEEKRLEGLQKYGKRILDWLDQTKPDSFKDLSPKKTKFPMYRFNLFEAYKRDQKERKREEKLSRVWMAKNQI